MVLVLLVGIDRGPAAFGADRHVVGMLHPVLLPVGSLDQKRHERLRVRQSAYFISHARERHEIHPASEWNFPYALRRRRVVRRRVPRPSSTALVGSGVAAKWLLWSRTAQTWLFTVSTP